MINDKNDTAKKQKIKSAKQLLELAWVQYLKENDDFYQAIHQLAFDFNNEMDDVPGIVDAGLIPIDSLTESLNSLNDSLNSFKNGFNRS
jgi:hypothetical protein